MKIVRQKKELNFTTSYEKQFSGADLRESLNQKQETVNQKYFQVFGDKLGFTHNLSVIDLLFNKGLETVDYLTVKI